MGPYMPLPTRAGCTASTKNNAVCGTNATSVVVDNQLVIAYEIEGVNNKNSVGLSQVDL